MAVDVLALIRTVRITLAATRRMASGETAADFIRWDSDYTPEGKVRR